MLLHYPNQTFECFRHADVCRRRAHAAADPKTRDEFLAMEERWRLRASTYEMAENLSKISRPRNTTRPDGKRIWGLDLPRTLFARVDDAVQ
jgi:hypothetical protein